MSKPNLDRPWPLFSLSASFVRRWSFCKRAAFWHTWWSWGAWYKGPTVGSESRRLAYALKTSTSVYMLAGTTVHRHAARFSRLAGHGRELPETDKAVSRAVGEYRDQVAKARKRSWKRASKKAPMLIEAFYDELESDELDERIERAAERVEASVRNLAADEHLDVLAAEAKAGRRPLVHVEDPVRVWLVGDADQAVDARPRLVTRDLAELGHPVELWVVPDLAYTAQVSGSNGRRELVIVDWKTGSSRPEHLDQLRIYATWAAASAWPAESVLLVASYLESGEVAESRIDEPAAFEALADLVAVVDEVRAVVEDGDLRAMVPKIDATGSAFPMREDGPACARCEWRRLCRRD
jgi:CRISPR/Cas system-associated exonuclease Cas4 (RecB family)